MFDFTDPDHPMEIAYFDRGPVDADELVIGGSWSGYWYNGDIYASEIARGLDILELTPSEHLSQNEIDAAKLVRFDELQPAEAAEDRVAGRLPGGAGVSRPARARQGARRRAHVGDRRCAERGREAGRRRRAAPRSPRWRRSSTRTHRAPTDGARVRAMAAAVRDLANAAS